jgi:hypothetical protein
MLAIAILSTLLGGVLALRFGVIALLPVIALMLVVVAMGGALRGEGVWSIAQVMAAVWVSVQFGYLAGAVLRSASWGPLRRPESTETLKADHRKLVVALGGIVLAIGWVVIRWLTA